LFLTECVASNHPLGLVGHFSMPFHLSKSQSLFGSPEIYVVYSYYMKVAKILPREAKALLKQFYL